MRKLVLLFSLILGLAVFSSCEKENQYAFVKVVEVTELEHTTLDVPNVTLEETLQTFRTEKGNVSTYELEYTVEPVPVNDVVLPGEPGLWNGTIQTVVKSWNVDRLNTDYMRDN